MIYTILYEERIDVSDGIDIIRTNASKERIICHYWYFLEKGFRFQPAFCDGFYDVLMTPIDIAISNIHDVDYHYIINGISTIEAIWFLKHADSNEKRGPL